MKRNEFVKLAARTLRAKGKKKLASAVTRYLGTAASAKQIADTILKQLGGAGRLKAMLGARDFLYDSNPPSLQFKFPNKVKGKPNYVKIIYDKGKDSYNMEFGRIRGQVKTVKTYKDIYADQLKELFEKTTGLRLSL